MNEKKKYFVRELRETDLMELILRAALLQLYYGKSEGGMLHYSSQMKMNAFRYLVGFRKTNQSMFHLVHNAELEYNTNTNDGGRWVYSTSIGNCR
jgi:Tfp pilus tip-associated adhesin PilY1